MTEDPLELGADEATLYAKMEELRVELSAHRPLVQRANRTARRAKVAAIIGVIVGALGAVIGVFGYRAQVQANEARNAARIASCVQENIRIERIRTALTAGLITFVPDPEHLTPEQQRALDGYTDAVGKILVYRDCSPPGIEAYLNNPPADPSAGD